MRFVDVPDVDGALLGDIPMLALKKLQSVHIHNWVLHCFGS